MFIVIDKNRLARLIAITRDDRRPKERGENGPFLRIEAGGDSIRITGRQVEAIVPATVHEPGVLFLRVTLFRRLLRAMSAPGFIAIQANQDGIMFGDTRIAPNAVDMLLYVDPATAPLIHPAERDLEIIEEEVATDEPKPRAGPTDPGLFES